MPESKYRVVGPSRVKKGRKYYEVGSTVMLDEERAAANAHCIEPVKESKKAPSGDSEPAKKTAKKTPKKKSASKKKSTSKKKSGKSSG